ncbi:unnamed protein product [Schistosoma spindalis]|nr:unnamed protein product [Schistosoma spindale]
MIIFPKMVIDNSYLLVINFVIVPLNLFYTFLARMPTGDKQPEKHKKESIIDLNKYIDKRIRVKFSGGREAVGILKGCDNLQNMVIDCTTEFLRDPDDPHRLTEDTRELALVVCRGPSVELVCPADGMESIPNPFVQQE